MNRLVMEELFKLFKPLLNTAIHIRKFKQNFY